MLYVQVSMWTSFRVSQPDSCLRKQWQNRSGKTSALGQMVPRSAVVSLEKLAVPGHSQVLYYRVCVGWGGILLLDKLVVPGHSQVLYYSLCVCVCARCVCVCSYWRKWLNLATHILYFNTYSVTACVCICAHWGNSLHVVGCTSLLPGRSMSNLHLLSLQKCPRYH